MSIEQADRRIAEILDIQKTIIVQDLPEVETTTDAKKAGPARIPDEQRQFLGDSSEEPRALEEDLAPPKKKQKARKSAKPDRCDAHQNALLKAELERPLSLEYRGIIKGSAEAVELARAYEHHIRRNVPPAEADPTWPSTEEMRRMYVRQIYEAIMNTTKFQEREEALQKLAKLEAKKSADVNGATKPKQTLKRKRGDDKPEKFKGLNATDAVYANPDSTPMDILRAAARCKCQRGWELRLQWSGEGSPSWEHYETFADRWEQMCYNKRHHKVTLHSALRGDWIDRLVAGPVGERKLKLGNKSLNCARDLQNKLGRQVMKERKECEEGAGGDEQAVEE
ncbi:hypothetical protein CSOJ01_15537 [Colletotrichum sojae]|uniref:Uncharacterized protein n=1 Tax=Colletotrichum sojae TaxID=2175907 RepID=A0A8H6IMA4_9PEZI|nr:hypothetical protein CSOJ01_15537 [Colletotrichum sojae]